LKIPYRLSVLYHYDFFRLKIVRNDDSWRLWILDDSLQKIINTSLGLPGSVLFSAWFHAWYNIFSIWTKWMNK
jgi:hypothetical protein